MKQMGAQAMAGARNMFREVLPILKRPVTETRRIAAGNSPLVGLELIGLKALIILIIVLIAASRISGISNGMIQMPYFKLIILTLLLTVGIDALEAVLLNAAWWEAGRSTTGLSPSWQACWLRFSSPAPPLSLRSAV